MGRKLTKTKPTNIDDLDIPLLVSMINDFTNATVLIEQDVSRRGLDHNNPTSVLNWMSLKGVSHFNLGTALELMLKLLLVRKGTDYKHIHGLTGLYLALPKEARDSLSATYRDNLQGIKYELVAVREKKPQQQRLKNRPISTIRDMLEYFDKDMKLDQKRYSWEPAQKRQWRHFINDPTAFVPFIRRVLEEETRKIARESGGKHGGTGTGKRGEGEEAKGHEGQHRGNPAPKGL